MNIKTLSKDTGVPWLSSMALGCSQAMNAGSTEPVPAFPASYTGIIMCIYTILCVLTTQKSCRIKLMENVRCSLGEGVCDGS